MARTSNINRDNKRRKMSKNHAAKRAKLKAIIYNRDLSLEERFAAQLKLAAMPRNGSKTRIHNRCRFSGRPRAYYRKFGLSRIALREFGNLGLIPGLIKASW
ncbi:MAG: 30S ribosomal protein S14 [Dongiaceae bacterium]